MPLQILFFSLILLSGAYWSLRFKKLTVAGSIAGMLLAILLYLGGGWTGFVLMTAFFVLGTAATSWKRNKKQSIRTVEEHQGRRTAGQVLANGGAGAVLGFLAWLYPQQKEVLLLMTAASFSSAAADTLSSELGSVYGKRFYNILSFKKDERGLDGVVSWEGSLLGLAGSFVIATVYSIGWGWNIDFLWIVIAGTAGNLVDSLLGALLERRGLIQNDLVNFFNTLAAALVALLLGSW